MSDGKEEREDQKTRLEQEKRQIREENIDRDFLDDSEPERVDS